MLEGDSDMEWCVLRWPSNAIVAANSVSKRCAKTLRRGRFEITEGATGSLSCHYRNTIHHVVSLFSHRLVGYRSYTVMIPPFETTFAVPLSCESCIKDVSTSLYKLPGMLSRYPSIYFLSV
jgi:hypothetical protein